MYGPCENLNGSSVNGSLGSEVRGRTWVLSDFVGHDEEFELCPDGHETHGGWGRS